MNKRIMIGVAAALALAGCGEDNPEVATNEAANQAAPGDQPLPGGGATAALGAAAIQVATKEPYGEYLVDGGGRAIYVLEGTQQQASQAPQQGQRCTGECLAEWPLVLTEGAPSAGQGVASSRLSSIDRPEGQQVAYAGWPLYYYRGDSGAGSTSGQDLHDRWGGWYLLSPSGERIEGREMGPGAE